MQRRPVSPPQERRSGTDRRSGLEWRSGADRRAEPRRSDELLQQAAPGDLSLREFLPHASFSEREAAERAAAIDTHRRELNAHLGREVGPAVAALDYLLNTSHELVAPAIIERGVLEVLERRSVTDPQTGLFNRCYFEAALKREIASCLRHGTRLSLLLIEVERLEAVAPALQNNLRRVDIAARIGGDEVAVILPDTGAREARVLAERLCAKTGACGGLAEFPLAAPSTSEAQLIVAATRALGLAKSRGMASGCVAEEVP
jgi:GGDEF domain-containing protein